jgi:hypothetical protein
MVNIRGRIGLRMDVAVPLTTQRNWNRKWRDVLAAHAVLGENYEANGIDVDDFTRRVEGFFKTCRELPDWIEEETGLPAIEYARNPPALELCDAVAQTAKHYKRKPSKWDPITATVVELFGQDSGLRADITWESAKRRGERQDALKLADDCIAEWHSFFHLHKLNPNA